MVELNILIDNVKICYNNIKKIDSSITDIRQIINLFNNFYESYWKLMSFFNLLIIKIRFTNKEKAEKIKKLQNFYTEKKIEIDTILLRLEDVNKIKNKILKLKNLANKIQIEVENQNSKYFTNLTQNDINKLSKELEAYYSLIIEDKNPIQESFLYFYEPYSKLMQELNKIKISKSKNNVDKIKKGLIAKKANIDKLFNSLFISNSNIKKVKENTNRLTPTNLELNNLNRIVLPLPPINIETNNHKVPNLNSNKIIELRKQSLIGQKKSGKNISRLKELELKRLMSELNKTEEAELKRILLDENRNHQYYLNNFLSN
jgi:hypothetical protein